MPMWCVAPLEMNEGNSLGQGYNRPTGCIADKASHATFNFFKGERTSIEGAKVSEQRKTILKLNMNT